MASSNPYNQEGAVASSSYRTYNKKDYKAGKINPYDQSFSDVDAKAEQKSIQDSQAKSRSKRLADDVVKTQKAKAEASKPKPKSGVEGFIDAAGKITGDINKKVYGTVNDFIGNEIVKPTITHLKDANEVVGVATKTDASTMRNQLAESQRKELTKEYNAGNITKERLQAGLKKLDPLYKKNAEDFKNSSIQNKDRTELAASVAGAALDIGLPGVGSKVASKGASVGANVGSKVVTKGVEKGAKELTKGAVKKLAKKIVSDEVIGGAAYGGAYGAQMQAEEKGDAVNMGDISGGVVAGAPAGATLGAVLPIIGKGVSKLLERPKDEFKLPRGLARPGEIVNAPVANAPKSKGAVKPLGPEKTPTPHTAEHLVDERAFRSGVKPFTDIDPLTSRNISKLESSAKNKAVPTGHTRLFQMNDGDLKSDQYFTDIDKLANFANNRSDNATMRFVDVPNKDVVQAPGKPDVFRIAEETPVKGGTRPLNDLQTRIEAAHNAGDTKLEASLNAQLPKGAESMGTTGAGVDSSAITDPRVAKMVADAQTRKAAGKPKTRVESTVAVPKLAERVRKDAIKKKMIYGFDKTFNDLPEVDRVNRKDQFKKATEIVLNDPERAKRIAMGEEAAPDGILNNSVWMATKQYAENTGDVDLMRQLANSELTTRATGMGQEISMLAEKDPHSAVTAMSDLASARAKAAEKRMKGKTIAKVEQADRKAIKAATPKVSKYDWESFVKAIKC